MNNVLKKYFTEITQNYQRIVVFGYLEQFSKNVSLGHWSWF